MGTIINFDKIRRFELSLEKTNQSVITAQFWNEVDQELGRVEQYVSEIEESNFGLHAHHYRFVDLMAETHRIKQMGRNAIMMGRRFRKLVNRV